MTTTITRLTKHHGLGNDFLVCDASQLGASRPWEALAKAWCDRRTGIGADGLLVMTIDGDDRDHLTMVLFNADGSRAEMSGNGIACLAQAALLTGLAGGPSITVATDAGLRLVRLAPGPDVRSLRATVDMGVVDVVDAPIG